MGVSLGKRARPGASTHLHQTIGFVTAANLCLGQADILHNIISQLLRSQPPSEFLLAFTIKIVKKKRDSRACVLNPIER